MSDFFAHVLAVSPPPPSFFEKVLSYIPKRGRPRSENSSKRNARRCQKYAENKVQAVLAQANQTLHQLPCIEHNLRFC